MLFEEPSREIDEAATRTIDAATEVHRQLGVGYHESVYEEALCVELRHRGLVHERQVALSVRYRNEIVGRARVDLVITGQLIVELKAVEALSHVHVAQMLSYLKMADLPLGLLINFNVPALRRGVRRIVRGSR